VTPIVILTLMTDDESPSELVRRDDSSCSSSGSESSSEDKDDDDFFNTIDRIDRDEVYDILMESKNYERSDKASNIIEGVTEVETVQEETTEDHDEEPAAETAGVAVSDTDSQGTYENQRSTRERKEPTRFDPAKGLNQTIATKKVKFKARDILKDLEHCHNMIGRERNLPGLTQQKVSTKRLLQRKSSSKHGISSKTSSIAIT
jgi:hypothetical protein